MLKLTIVTGVTLLALTVPGCRGSDEPPARAPQASPAATSGAATPSTGVRTFAIVPAESKASYIADEELFAQAFTKFGLPAGWAKVVGTTQAVEGRFQLDMARPGAWLGDNQFSVRMNTFASGRDMRDNWIREKGPRFNDYPLATFKATAISENAAAATPEHPLSFNLHGTLTIRERPQPATFAVKARLDGDTLRGVATTRVRMSSFGIETITFVDTLTVADEIALEVQFAGRAGN